MKEHEVSLREVTADTVREICRLRVEADQEGLVAPVAESIAEAYFVPKAWFRAVYAGDTLVLLMAAERLPEVCAQLIAAGRPADQPAAVIASASTGAQQVVTGTLAELAATREQVDPPATLVCGPSVALAGSLAWFTRGQLAPRSATARA